MKQQAFDELVTSVRQAGRIRRGHARSSRQFTYRSADIAAIRDRLNKSQSEFAQMIGVSVATLQNWEQGRRVPNGPALALLRVTAANPRMVERALATPSKRGAA
jgi:putative transcriptional regulator